MKLDDALAGIDSLGFDTAPIIYFVEAHPHYDTLVTEVFRRVAAGALQGVTSVITLTEVLVHPFRHGNQHLGDDRTARAGVGRAGAMTISEIGAGG